MRSSRSSTGGTRTVGGAFTAPVVDMYADSLTRTTWGRPRAALSDGLARLTA
ncbi:hypothetical protein [Streptomyces acidicola]|uniref:hypothetical protein n=1 Tax=Streptomyces acidicola TaxID=2596892 RepID=UPI001884089F|nr:hypothetical protein [Streptomyces acidicola]